MNNPFQLFGLAQHYQVDEQVVMDKYLDLQKQFHPDNFASRTAKEKLMATQISANVAAAYNILLDPVKRASALLNLKGMSFDLENYISRDKMLLMEQMTLREQLEDSEITRLPNLRERWESDFSRLEESLTNYLAQEQLEDAAEVVLKMRYYQKLLTELKHKSQHG